MDALRIREGVGPAASGVRSVYEHFLKVVIDEGRAIVAEAARLVDLVPSYIVQPAKSKYKPILLDFNYFVNMEQHDGALALYQDLDDDIFAENKSLLSNLANLFNSLASFVTTFKQYLDESCKEEQFTEWDTVRELELEAFYLLGLVCLTIEKHYSAATLERLIVLLFRLSDERSSGIVFALDFLHAPQNAEDSIFTRVGVPQRFVEDVLEVFGDRFHETQVHAHSLARLRPLLPSLLFLCLRFCPPTLTNTPRLSRILDLFFRDQWVICIGGLMINLVDEWAAHKLLSSLLSSRVSTARAKSLAEQHMHIMQGIDLPQGAIRVSAIPKLAPLLAKYNGSLQWLTLHSYDAKFSKKSTALANVVKQTVGPNFEPHNALAIVARVEQRLITVYERSLRSKSEEVSKATASVLRDIDEIVQVLNVTPNLPLKEERKTKLIEWFGVLKTRVSEEASGAKAAELAVEVKQRVEHAISSVGLSLTLAAVLPRLAASLDALFALSTLTHQHLRQVKASSAPAYAIDMLPGWSPHLQLMLLERPLPLRSLCFKLFLTVSTEISSVHNSNRKAALRRALSARLSRRLRASLATLPQQIFEVIDTCILPQLEHRWPAALDKSEVKKLADIDERLRLAEGTRALGNLSLGIASLSARSIGAHPREVVADGIREELRRRLTSIVTSDLPVHDAMRKAGQEASLLRSALVSACEQLRVNGSAIWREEVSAIFDKEARRLVERAAKRKTWDDAWLDEERGGGREKSILRLIIDSTNYKKSRYIAHEHSWQDARSGKELFSPSSLSALETALPSCTASLSLLLRTRAVSSVRTLVAQLRTIVPANDTPSEALVRASRTLPANASDQLAIITQSLLLADFLDHARMRISRLLIPDVSRALRAAAEHLAATEGCEINSTARLVPLLRQLGLTRASLTPATHLHSESSVPSTAAIATFSISTQAALFLALHLSDVGGAQTTMRTLPLAPDAIPVLIRFIDTVLSGRCAVKHRPNVNVLRAVAAVVQKW